MTLSAPSFLKLIGFIIVIVGIGSFIGYTSGGGASSEWYSNLNKPPLNPPGFVFGIVWPILYTLMAIAVWWTGQQKNSVAKNSAQGWFITQLLLNYAWSYIFFTMEQASIGFLWILLILGATLMWVRALKTMSYKIAMTQIPYILWLCFAAYLNGMIVWLN